MAQVAVQDTASLSSPSSDLSEKCKYNEKEVPIEGVEESEKKKARVCDPKDLEDKVDVPGDNLCLERLCDKLDSLFGKGVDKSVIISTMNQYLATGSQDWKEFILWNEKRYTRNLVRKTEDYELMVICWKNGQQSPIHDHEFSSCWMGVLDGIMEETYYHIMETKEDPFECPILQKGTTYHREPADVGYIDNDVALHRVRPYQGNGISLHLYSPPITECTIYCQELNRITRSRATYYSVNKQVVNP